MVFKILLKLVGGYHPLRTKIKKANKLSKFVYKVILKGVEQEYGAYLPVNNSIAGPIHFPHGPFGVFITIGASIGEGCVIYQHVTIGSNMLIDSKGFGYPTIGNNCYIGAGAKIIGSVVIGNNCRIGANAVVTSDVPSNSVVVSPKSIIISKEKLNNTNYIISEQGLGYRKDGKFVLETDTEILTKYEAIIKRQKQ